MEKYLLKFSPVFKKKEKKLSSEPNPSVCEIMSLIQKQNYFLFRIHIAE